LTKRIDLNVDIGEGFPHDRELLEFATSANICCGVHAGDEALMASTINLCRSKRIRFGAHPGYPDRGSMGRASIDEEHQKEYLDSIFSQLRRFASYAKPGYVKPHGAFYNDTGVPLTVGWDLDEFGKQGYQAGGVFLARHPGVHSLAMILRVYRIPLMGLAGTAHEAVAMRTKQLFFREGFADRAYRDDGTLLPRSEPGAVLDDLNKIRDQVLRLAPNVDSLCLHGDTPGCLEFAELVRKTLLDAGYEVGS
jgi:UPF0271 protein